MSWNAIHGNHPSYCPTVVGYFRACSGRSHRGNQCACQIGNASASEQVGPKKGPANKVGHGPNSLPAARAQNKNRDRSALPLHWDYCIRTVALGLLHNPGQNMKLQVANATQTKPTTQIYAESQRLCTVVKETIEAGTSGSDPTPTSASPRLYMTTFSCNPADATICSAMSAISDEI